MKKLFEENKAILRDFADQIRVTQIQGRSEFEEERDRLISRIVDAMAGHPETWDEMCPINIRLIGDGFINELSGTYLKLSKDKLDTIASLCFRFLLEFDLSTGRDLDLEFERAKDFAIKRADEFEPNAKWQIQHACHQMPITICKSVLNSDAIGSIQSLNSSLEKAATWAQELSAKEEKVNRLKEALDEAKEGFNFVGLHKGFAGLAEEKKNERKSILFWLIMLGTLAVLPIIVELAYIAYVIFYGTGTPSDETGMPSVKQILAVLPVISLVALFIYYFRVLLFNYRAVKSQLMQIELRKALCQFVQSYAEYAKEIREKTPEVLDRFDKIVFSEIMADEGNLPSLHDGVEQIASAIKSLKK